MSEELYDNKIAPALKELTQECLDNGMSLIAVVEYAPAEHGRTTYVQADHSIAMTMVDIAAQSNGNIDTFFFSMARYAQKHGHSSVVLSQMGVPFQPKKEIKFGYDWKMPAGVH